MISLLQSVFVQSVAFVSWVGFDYACNFINFARQSSGADKFRKFPIQKIDANSKLRGHGGQFNSFIRFQELCIDDNSGFPNEISQMMFDIWVFLDKFDDFDENLEEIAVATLIERINKFFNLWKLH